jgi:formylglycine-generating enzyme
MTETAALRASAIAALGLASCTLLTPLDGFETEGGNALTNDAATDTSTAGGGDAGSDAPTSPGACPGTGGPIGVQVRTVTGTFCIDRTEVTRAQYNEFLRTNPSTADQPSECARNTSFGPLTTPDGPDTPVGNVDWCDAKAFCRWAGKRLCGKIGGGSLHTSEVRGANVSQWTAACSADATRAYAYGASYDPLACNGRARGLDSVVAVASLAACEGGFPGIFDLSGNVSEWEDACEELGTPSARCVFRGGDFTETSETLSCAAMWKQPIDYQQDYIGFRCCSP